MAQISFDLPTDADKQLLVGAVFAESTTKFTGGENAEEKICIGMSIVNMAYYGKQKNISGKKCYNSSYGDGTILSAIKKGVVAYGGAMWNKVMSSDKLKDKETLASTLNKFEIEHLENTVKAVEQIDPAQSPLTYALLNRTPLQFNRANDSPPGDRLEKIGRYGSHSFYGFKSGRECQ